MVETSDNDASIPLTELADPARKLSLDAFCERYARAFLVLHGVELRVPRGPTVTPKPGLGVDSTASLTFRALLVKRRATSEFPFISVGRNEGNDIYIPDVTISKFHAYFKDEADTFLLQDGRSRNGTFVGSERIAARGEGPPHRLVSGDAVRFGSINTTFLDARGLRDMIQKIGAFRP